MLNSRNILPTQEAIRPALIKGNQQLPLTVDEDGNEIGDLNTVLPGRLGWAGPGTQSLEISWACLKDCALGIQQVCSTRAGQDTPEDGWTYTSDLFDELLVNLNLI
jgi:hypothetical protein